ncbi:MAG: NAD(P)H-dependent oxidoreductase subunit E [Armatimonadetes bacterium]|nr:NAD(P)H-dependent oxidoreductase subunit E [Armatimonadota bacterium]
MNAVAATHNRDGAEDVASFVDRLVGEIGRGPEALIPILQAIQRQYRYLPEEALRRVCEITEITPAAIAGVSTFYSQFRHRPVGRHLISLCCGTACHVKGTGLIEAALRRHLRLSGDEDTDADGVFTLQKVACLGCCTLAPVMQIDGVTYGHLTPDTVAKALRDFLELARRGLIARDREDGALRPTGLAEIRFGVGSCCVAGGSLEVGHALARAVQESGALAVVKPVGCVGMCHQTPLVEVLPAPDAVGALYAKVTPKEAEGIVRRHFKPRGVVGHLKTAWSAALDRLLTDDTWEPVTRYAIDARDAPVCAFLGRQKRIATEYCGSMDPLDLDEYLAHEGFAALRKAIGEDDPEAIIDTITRSGLRGRGGAGFPTGRKWATVRAAVGDTKYIILNGDEGDPGAFMDRMLLESYPYRVLEGMAIAAWSVGASEGVLYIRAEYPLAVRRMRAAIRRGEERGFLGENLLGSGFSLRLRIMEGAGAFVCGEETALLAALEGRRGMPRLRPPYPAECGLWGRPTCINNVETYAVVPWIIRHGAGEFAALGTEKSKGTKVFALTGKVRRGGLIEVPMGITIREIVEEIGGGPPEGSRFKAVQIGGPSGGCIPADLADTPVDYEALASVGAIMGSGGLVVLDDRTCMVDIARYFLQFTQNESCGKCTFCRIGTRRLLDLMERLCAGQGRPGDLEKLAELSGMVKQGSLCGLGQTAPNPVLTSLRYFRDEYLAHLEGRCPAGTCQALIRYRITDQCIGCTKCAQECPADAIPLRPFEKHEIIDAACTRCDTCRRICPEDAVRVE